MTSVLDTIDHAIADHELSADAMRWTPEPPDMADGGHVAIGTDLATFIAEWQRDVILDQMDRTATWLMRRAQIWAAVPPALLASRQPERVTRMRRAYRARRGRRW